MKTAKKGIMGFALESTILIFSFYFIVWLRFDTIFAGLLIYKTSVYFYGIFIFLSLFSNKNMIWSKCEYSEVIYPIALSNLIILAIFVGFGRFIYPFTEFRFLSIYAVFVVSVIEILGGALIVTVRQTKAYRFYTENDKDPNNPVTVSPEQPLVKNEISSYSNIDSLDLSKLYKIVVDETNLRTYEFISRYFTTILSDTLIISSTNGFNVINQPKNAYKVIINLKRINDIQFINKFFEAVNSKLDNGNVYIDWVETYIQRKQRILAKYPDSKKVLRH